MDNLAHTLVGGALAAAGLKRKTGLGLPTLMIAANLPDVDALGLLFGENLAWRRGWTHGPVALVILPVLLAAVMVTFDRWQQRRGRRPATRAPVRFGWVLALAYVGILSHPLLDFLNTYGIRCLMPFSESWFYGDALFIIDPWFWSALGIGIWLSARRERRGRDRAGRPALIALLLVASYSGLMGVAGRAAERQAARDIAAQDLGQPARVLASPVPLDPFRRRIVFEIEDGYGFGNFRWLSAPRLTLEPGLVRTSMDDPAIAQAAHQEKAVADFLYWSRYPFASIRRGTDRTEVIIGDARYNRRPDDGPFTVRALLSRTAPAPGQPPKGQTPASPRE